MIWFKKYTLEDLAPMRESDSILKHLGLQFTEIGPDYLKATLPVDARTHQPYGLLHGGSTCVLAETLGSVASIMVVDPAKNHAVGSVIIANHMRPIRSGLVTGTCTPVHLGRTKHVWDIRVVNDEGKLVAKCELTCAVTEKEKS
ncbi:MAG TPA: hotdog fold thioesterase [Patescibacteria group bacterium]|nr:hotdog fold thioesterase [Patescibacteria group bacterium]